MHRVLLQAGNLKACCDNRKTQATVDEIAGGLTVTASAPDGIIEALEVDDATWAVGVQWHPEEASEEATGPALFAGLVAAARSRSR